MRDYNTEFAESDKRLYAYNFDYRMHEFMERSFAPWLRGDRALELGCYEGAFTRRIRARFPDTTVIEGSDQLIAMARDAVNPDVRFVHGRFEDVDPGAPFDAVFLIHTLEHLDDPLLVLQRIRAWLKPSGRLFLAVPNANAASRQIAVNMGLIPHNAAVTEGEHAHGHRATYSLDTLLALASDAGLQIIASGGVCFKPLANFQLDRALEAGILDDRFFEGCYRLGQRYPDLCASIYAVCAPPPGPAGGPRG